MQKCADEQEKKRENPLIMRDVFVVDKITLKLSSVIYNTAHQCMYVLFIKLHIVVSVVMYKFCAFEGTKNDRFDRYFVVSDMYLI